MRAPALVPRVRPTSVQPRCRGRCGRARTVVGWALSALLFAALAACFDGPDYEGRSCSADAPCPTELICDLDLRCHLPCRETSECPGPRPSCGADGRCHTTCAVDGDCTRDGERCAMGVCTATSTASAG